MYVSVFIVPQFGFTSGFIGKYQTCLTSPAWMGGDVIGYAFCVSSISDLDKLIIRVLSTTLQLNVMLKKVDTTTAAIINTVLMQYIYSASSSPASCLVKPPSF